MQQDLFNSSNPVPEVINLDAKGQSYLLWFHGFYSRAQADSLFTELQATVPWEQAEIKIAGRILPIPRLQAWFGEPDAVYGYSGIELTPVPFTETLLTIKRDVENAGEKYIKPHLNCRFNSLLANLYRDGSDSVGWHADNEKPLGENPLIASVSFGSKRRFSLKHRIDRSIAPLHLDLDHGDLLLMAGATQHQWQHQVPKTKACHSPRINLTLRKIHVK